MKNLVTPDGWKHWKFKKNNEIDYDITDYEYMKKRKEYLKNEVLKKDFDRLLKEIDTYSSRQALAWGCGSGKTTKIKYLGAKHSKSMLIIVNTNEEVDKMVFDIKSLDPKQSVIGLYQDSQSYKSLEENKNYFYNFNC